MSHERAERIEMLLQLFEGHKNAPLSEHCEISKEELRDYDSRIGRAVSLKIRNGMSKVRDGVVNKITDLEMKKLMDATTVAFAMEILEHYQLEIDVVKSHQVKKTDQQQPPGHSSDESASS